MKRDFNTDGFIQYYNAQTKRRNEKHLGTIKWCIDDLETYLSKNYRGYRTTSQLILDNKTTFYNKLKTWLTADGGLSKAMAESVIKYMKTFLKNGV